MLAVLILSGLAALAVASPSPDLHALVVRQSTVSPEAAEECLTECSAGNEALLTCANTSAPTECICEPEADSLLVACFECYLRVAPDSNIAKDQAEARKVHEEQCADLANGGDGTITGPSSTATTPSTAETGATSDVTSSSSSPSSEETSTSANSNTESNTAISTHPIMLMGVLAGAGAVALAL